jgi:O-antigen/teichoic acid export membrane protein
MSLYKTVISGVKWTSIGTLGRSLFQILQISILTRFLPKEAFGLVAMALFIVQFSNIFLDMGFTSSILHRQNATKKEYSSIYWLNIMISLCLYFILILITPLLAKFYNETELNRLIPILGSNIIIMAIGMQHKTIMQKQFRFKSISITELISVFIGLIVAILLAVNNFGIYSLVYSTLVSSFVLNILFLIQNLRLNPILLHFKLKETKLFLKIGFYDMGSKLLDFFSREIDILIIGKILGAEILGGYSLAKQIILKIFSLINPIIISILSPLLSSIQNEKTRLKNSYLKVVKYLAYINFFIYSFIIIASKELLHIIYGIEYSIYYHVLSFLAFSYCLVSLSNPVGSLQIATGRTDIGLKWTLFRIIITPPIIYAGALISIEAVAGFYASISMILILPLWYIQLKPMINVTLNEYVSQFYKPLFFFLIITIINYSFSINLFYENSILLNAIFKITITIFTFVIYIFVVDKNNFMEFYKNIYSSIKKIK